MHPTIGLAIIIVEEVPIVGFVVKPATFIIGLACLFWLGHSIAEYL